MADFSNFDFAKMQSDAVKGVEDMKKRSKSYFEQDNLVKNEKKNENLNNSKKEIKIDRQNENKDKYLSLNDEKKDDFFIILILIMILSEEGAEQGLIFALLYIIL